ncbi:hypothetical protein [Burkholderia perseverans]|uniref:hypothetical protein n=1 Tax=Burkholderia perseverans TaxID=2615214 RepID=UPI001FED834C|nr:hypothetical protein [Burkholderia perseverans]
MSPIRSPSPSPSITTPSTPVSPGTADGAEARPGRGLPATQSGPAQLAGLRSRSPASARGEGGAEGARTGRSRAASHSAETAAPARSTDPAESARMVAGAESITTLPALQAALGELGGLDPSLHAKPLGALANRIETLPSEDRAAAFQAVSNAVGELPPAAQSHPLARLGFQACELPEPADRARAFQNTFASMEHVVSSGQATPGEHAQMLAGLAYSVPGLTPERQQAEVGRLMTQIGKLPAGSRGAPISSIAYRLDAIDPGVRQAAFDGAISHLEPGGGGKAELTALAAGVHQLPDPGKRQEAFDELLPRIDKLAGPDRGEAVQNLTMQIVHLPAQNMLPAVNTMLGVVGEPGEDPHLQMAQQLLNHFRNLLSQAVDA